MRGGGNWRFPGSGAKLSVVRGAYGGVEAVFCLFFFFFLFNFVVRN